MNLPRWGILLIDLTFSLLSITAAYLLRFNFDIPEVEYHVMAIAYPLILSVRLISFFIFKTYAGIIFHTSIEDAQRIFWAISTGTLAILIATPVLLPILGFNIVPYSITIIDFVVMMFLMLSFRIFVKILYLELNNLNKDKRKVIIYGAGAMGITTKKALDRDQGVNYSVNAFVDDDDAMEKKRLLGIEIYSSKRLEQLLHANRTEMLIISTPTISLEKKQELVETCLKYEVKVLNVPPMSKWINGELSFKQIKEIRIEDLLERDPIQLDENNIEHFIKGKTILITGAAGSIGSEIARQTLRYFPKQLVLIDQAETPLHELDLELSNIYRFRDYQAVIADICNQDRMKVLFETFKPDIVFHAAAYKHVPMMEANPAEAVLTNIGGTKIIADLSVQFGVRQFVFVSTDKAVNPSSMMGASKRAAEIYVQALDQHIKNQGTRFVTTRFGNVLGSNGSVIPLFKKQIAEGGPVTVTHPKMTRFFMTIPEACQLVLEAGAMGEGGEIFVFDMGRSIKILDLAKKMIRLSGLEIGKDIHIVFTGLRPGEKLYEELLNKAEKTLPTHHPKILKAKVREYELAEAKSFVEQLLSLSCQKDNEQVVRLLKKVIPEYQSLNSVFEKLDSSDSVR